MIQTQKQSRSRLQIQWIDYQQNNIRLILTISFNKKASSGKRKRKIKNCFNDTFIGTLDHSGKKWMSLMLREGERRFFSRINASACRLRDNLGKYVQASTGFHDGILGNSKRTFPFDTRLRRLSI